MENLNRLNEEEEADRQGVFHILGKCHFPLLRIHLTILTIGILENVLGFNPDLATLLVTKTNTLPWTLKRIQSTTHDDNRGYAAEVLSILLQNNRDHRLDFGQKDGIEVALKVLSVSTTFPTCVYRDMNAFDRITEGAIQRTETKPNSWRTSLIHCALLSPSLKTKSCSWIARE